jgi:hypothetical protein
VLGAVETRAPVAVAGLSRVGDLTAIAPVPVSSRRPGGTWTTPPPGRDDDASRTPYGDWLVAGFDEWYGASPQTTSVRLFQDTLSLIFGGPSASEQIGTGSARVIVVDTDGSLEQVDTLKSAYDGAPATGFSVHSAPFDAALRHPSVAARQLGVSGLCDTCRSCPERNVCGFLHPTVYCADMMRFVTHVRGRERGRRAAEGRRRGVALAVVLVPVSSREGRSANAYSDRADWNRTRFCRRDERDRR